MNIDPVLICEPCQLPTLHIFVERRPQPPQPGETLYVDCIYECDLCGDRRPWGNEPREETAYGIKLAAEALSHAVEKHGMRRERCPSCRGADFDCVRCGDDGKTWVFDDPNPCDDACPLASLEPPVDE
jgi:hypothetical protein